MKGEEVQDAMRHHNERRRLEDFQRFVPWLDQCLTELLQKGVVTKEEARFRAQNKDAF